MSDVVEDVRPAAAAIEPPHLLVSDDKDVVEIKDEDIGDEDIDDDEECSKFGAGAGAGRTVTLQMLLAAKILTPGKSTMSIEYLGQKFVGDLLPDGKIKSQETETIFCSPSAWAMHCKRIINPDKKSGCGWASVKYKGKKLDAYKAQWVRKCQAQKDATDDDDDKKESTPPPPIKRTVVPHNTISNRNIPHDANTLIEAIPFSSMGKMQPFLITIAKSAIFLMDFHCHLTKTEVCGYLGGTWDLNSLNLVITHTFPCRNCRHDRENAGQVEMEIQKSMMKQNLTLVGWYHSHPKSPSQPTLRDCDTQLEYQIKMKGSESDASYSPCVGFICSPYNDDNPSLESTIMAYWILPPPENKPLEYGRPMLMSFTITPDTISSLEFLQTEILALYSYYKQFDKMLVHFSDNYRADSTYIEKMKNSLYQKFPKEESDNNFWNLIREIIHLDLEESFEKPKNALEEKHHPVMESIDLDAKSEESSEGRKSQPPSSTITSLQQQLSLPVGLNMNPTPLAAVPTNNNFSTNSTTSSSPRDSPITISSNAASPGKFEIPVRASPSPAKSDTSSTRTRNSPAPSPRISNSSPSLAPPQSTSAASSLYDLTTSGMSADSMNDFLTASLASLAAKLPPGMQPSELALLFQQKLAEYGVVTGFNPTAAAAALTVPQQSKPTPTPPPPPPAPVPTPQPMSSAKHGSYKDLYKDLEKYDMNYLLAQQYNLGAGMTLQKSNKSSTSKSSSSSGGSKRNYETGIGSTSVTPASSKSAINHPVIDLEDSKSELSRLSDFMKSPEYASLLLQHAAGYGGGNYGLGSEISISKKSSKKNSTPSYSAHDLSALLQGSSGGGKNKALDFSALLEQHKLPDLTSITPIDAAGLADMSAFFGRSSKKGSSADSQAEMLNSLFQNVTKASDINSLLFAQSMAGKSSDLSAYFTSPSPTPSSASSTKSLGLSEPATNPLLPNISPAKVQEISSLFQHVKYPGIPDPLAKSTLAANNMYMTPTASLLKMQQEAINAMMMKPPKATTPLSSLSSSSGGSSTAAARNTETPPAPERPTSKSSANRGDSPLVIPPSIPPSSSSNLKYNFSAADLAVSSIPSALASPSTIADYSRRLQTTPPVDMSSLGPPMSSRSENTPPPPQAPPKKRMEFSSIADLAAPPSKLPKLDDQEDDGGALNLSSS